MRERLFRLVESVKDYRGTHITFALKKRKVIAVGKNNRNKTHTTNTLLNHVDETTGKHFGATTGTHSELSCLLKLKRQVCNDLVFVNIRINHHGELTMSKPCPACMDMFEQVGFKKIYYSNYEAEFETIIP